MPLEAQLNSLHETFVEAVVRLGGFVKDMEKHIAGQSKVFEGITRKVEAAKAGEEPAPIEPGENAVRMELDEDEVETLVKAVTHRSDTLARYPNMLLNMALIYLVALYDAYVGDVFFAVLMDRPDMLKSSKRSLTFEKAIELESRDDLISFLARRELDDVSYKSVADQVSYYSTRFGIAVEDSGVDLDALIEVRARRNLLVHNNGVVNDTYLAATARHGVKRGEILDVPRDYWNARLKDILAVARHVHDDAISRFAKDA
jgi:hypothetical protein